MQELQISLTLQAAAMTYVLAIYTAALFEKAPKPFSCAFCMTFWWSLVVCGCMFSFGQIVNPLLAVFVVNVTVKAGNFMLATINNLAMRH